MRDLHVLGDAVPPVHKEDARHDYVRAAAGADARRAERVVDPGLQHRQFPTESRHVVLRLEPLPLGRLQIPLVVRLRLDDLEAAPPRPRREVRVHSEDDRMPTLRERVPDREHWLNVTPGAGGQDCDAHRLIVRLRAETDESRRSVPYLLLCREP